MTLLFNNGDGGVRYILHPSDFSEASEVAFDHALSLAVHGGAHFTLLHAVGRRATDNWPGYPSARSRIAQWSAAGSIHGFEDRVRQATITKREMDVRDPAAAAGLFVEKHPVDMLVLATKSRRGLSRLLGPPRAETLARETKLLTLFVPDVARPFVHRATGDLSLHRILIPVDPATDPRPAMSQAVSAAAMLRNPSVEITLLHVGEGADEVTTDVPDLPFCRWHVVRRSGDVVDEILRTAEASGADAIYMSTAWNRAQLLRTGHGVTEAILDSATCPVVAVPVA